MAPVHLGRGLPRENSAVTLFAGDAPHGISDHASLTARGLGGSIGWWIAGLWNSSPSIRTRCSSWVPSTPGRSPRPDGRRTISSATSMRWCHDRTGRSWPNADHGEGTNLRFASGDARPDPDAMIPKFASMEEIHIVVPAGTAGVFPW